MRHDILLAVTLTGFFAAACGSSRPMPAPTAAPNRQAPLPDRRAASPAAAPFVDQSIDDALAGRARPALEAAQEATRQDPHGLAANVALVEALLGVSEPEAALAAAEHLVDHHPRRVEAHYAHGRALMALGQHAGAARAFADALAITPHDVTALFGRLAAIAPDPARGAEVARLAETLQAVAPDSPYLAHSLAVAAEARGDHAAAVAGWEALTRRDPPLIEAYFNLARVVEETRGPEAARPIYEAFIQQAGPAHRRAVEEAQRRLRPHQGEPRREDTT